MGFRESPIWSNGRDTNAGVWGSEYSGDGELLRATVKNLRRKLGDDASEPIYFFTEPRVGYRMAKP